MENDWIFEFRSKFDLQDGLQIFLYKKKLIFISHNLNAKFVLSNHLSNYFYETNFDSFTYGTISLWFNH